MSVIDYKLNTPFEKMTFEYAMNNYGCDKPDLRFDLKLLDVSDIFSKTKSDIFKNKIVKLLNFDNHIPSKDIKVLEEIAQKNKVEKIISIKITDSKFNENNLNNLIKDELNNIIKKLNIINATLIFAADEKENVNQALGAVRTKVNELYSLANENEYKFV